MKRATRITSLILAGVLTLTGLVGLFLTATTAFAAGMRFADEPVFYRSSDTWTSDSEASKLYSRYDYYITASVIDSVVQYRGEPFKPQVKVTDPDSGKVTSKTLDTEYRYVMQDVLIMTGSGNFSGYLGGSVKAKENVFGEESALLGYKGAGGYLAFDFTIDLVSFDGLGQTLDFDIQYNYVLVDAETGTPITYQLGANEEADEDKNPAVIASSGNITTKVGKAVVEDDGDGDGSTGDDSYLIATPNIIIDKYTYSADNVVAGTEFPLYIKFRNTSKELDLENIIMEITTSTDLSPTSSSSSIYIEKLEKGATMEKTIMMSVKNTTEPGPQQITVSFNYEYVQDKKRLQGERSEKLAIPVIQNDRFEISEPEVPDQIWPGDRMSVYMSFYNKGKSTISNLTALFECEGMDEPRQQELLGNLEPGKSVDTDFNLSSYTPGEYSGTITITYEDSSGNEKQIVKPFTTSVMQNYVPEPEDPGMIDPMPMPEETGMAWYAKLALAVGGLAVAGVTGTVVVLRAKAKREEDENEDI